MTTALQPTRTLQILRTESHACSYLKGQLATTEFVSPDQRIQLSTYQGLNDLGFRRSGQHYYRPNCQSCQACKPLRVLADQFRPNRAQRRVLKRNLDLTIRMYPRPDSDYYALYQRYIEARHADGDMYPPSRDQFDDFIASAPEWTRFIEFRSDKLLMVAVCDFMPLGLSAIYSFFAPEEESRSLGTFAILKQIEFARRLQMPHLYMGYWIKDCAKMSYKTAFRPFEVLQNGEWLPPAF